MIRNIAKKISRSYKKLLPYTHVFKELCWSLKYLRFKRGAAMGRRVGVMRVDGRGYHGGMIDRFNGAISWWNYCEKNGLDFRLHYVYPFKLTDYIVPNEYDWRIDEKDIPDGAFDTRIFYGRGEKGQRLERLRTKKHIWYYGNTNLGDSLNYAPYNRPWNEAFKKLFKPSELVDRHLAKCREEIGGNYVAVVYRFQNLLGDFNERWYRTITDVDERQSLVDRCLEELEKVHEENSEMKVLVTADSVEFLALAAQKSYVYVIPGKVEHMDFTDGDSNHTQLKSFLDFFMIAGAERVYSIVVGDMYTSQFPQYAARLNDVPFERRIYR